VFASTDELTRSLASEQAKALRSHTTTFADSDGARRFLLEEP
jgi:hypothetical protein